MTKKLNLTYTEAKPSSDPLLTVMLTKFQIDFLSTLATKEIDRLFQEGKTYGKCEKLRNLEDSVISLNEAKNNE